MLVALPAVVEITIAPDQPLPYVYIDDPLIIEFLAPEEMEIEARLFLQMAHTGYQETIDLGRMRLHAGSGYWRAVHDAPRARGIYIAEFEITTGEKTFRDRARFCRIDRPASLQHLPLYAYCSGSEETCALPAIRSVGIDTIRCDVENEYFDVLAEDAAIFGVNLIVATSAEKGGQFPDSAIEAIQRHCESILRFDLSCNAAEQCRDIAEVLRQLKCPSSASVVVPDAETFAKILQGTSSLAVKQATLMAFDWPEMTEIQAMTETPARYGQEGWQTHIICPFWQPRGAGEAARFAHRFLQYQAAHISNIGINAAVIADEMDIKEMMAYLNGLALRFRGNAYVGALPSGENVQALLFRNGAEWFLAVWREQGEATITIPVDGAVRMELSDALGNAVALPEINNGAIDLPAGIEPLYLTGNGGIILGKAALQQAEQTAGSVLASPELSEQLPQGIVELVRHIMTEPKGAGSRRRFLELLRVLPLLEEQWHAHKLPKHIAVPAIAKLAALARTLCLVEEERGEHFLEPLSDMLSRAEELQSLYLTGSAGTAQARERGDWILGEVRRLIDEAEALEKADRKIEAAAVAALAEWRAHCLVHATQADPLREAAFEVPPLVLPTPEDAIEIHAQPEEAETQAQHQDDKEKTEETTDAAENTANETTDGKSKEITHIVKSGDSPYGIAKKYNVPLDDFMKWNNLNRKSILRIGQKLIVRTPQ